MKSLVDRVDAVLPQTQCTKCGFGGCRPYAEAMVGDGVAINRCPPGGTVGIRELAKLLGREIIDLDPECGTHGPLKRAVIVEPLCIGCTLCIDACPVDAIVGASRHMHSVIAAHCTGCELCVAPCPMDCITMEVVQPPRDWTTEDADAARERMLARRRRLSRAIEGAGDRQHPSEAVQQPADRRATIDAARARARARRDTGSQP